MTALLPPNVKVHLALGYIDMRKGIDGLAILGQHPRRAWEKFVTIREIARLSREIYSASC